LLIPDDHEWKAAFSFAIVCAAQPPAARETVAGDNGALGSMREAPRHCATRGASR
jgi:hypothetical protein